MIYACPFCGHPLDCQLKDGLTQCSHCHRVIDSSPLNQLLSAGWLVRRHNYSVEQLQFQTQLPENEAILVTTFVDDNCYSHEDFLALLKKLGISNKSY